MSENPEKKPGSAPKSELEKTVRIDMDHSSSYSRTAATGGQSDPGFTNSRNGEDLPKLTQKPQEKYIFRKSLGRGGMKMVIQVKDRDTMRDIAMAVFPDAANRPASESRRFIDEARITASLEHPNIVPVHDIGIDATGAPYFTMKLLRGETLASILKKLRAGDPEYIERYPLEQLLRIFNKVCDAVSFAHSKGVIHLDLKPENIQISDFGEVLLMDFGLAKVISKADEDLQKEAPVIENKTYIPGVTIDGVTKGTPGYMAPEQAAGKNSLKDFRTDVYSLGAILYSIATCENPLSSQGDMKQMMLDTVNGRIIPPRERTPERMIPGALEAVIQKAMSVQLPNRYQSVKELREEIRAFLNGFATRAEKAGPAKQFLLFIRRNKITFPAITISILLLLGISFYAIRESGKQKSGLVELYSDDYTDGRIDAQNYAFYNSTLTSEVPAWSISKDGIKMQSREWFFLDKLNMGAGERVVLQFVPEKDASIRLALHTVIEPLTYGWDNPEGYTVVLGGFNGSLDIIYRNEKRGSGTVLASSDSKIVPGKLNTVTITREYKDFSIQINNNSIQKASDIFPLPVNNNGAFGISANGNVLLKSMEIYRIALPEKASPLIAGDVLLQRKYYNDAIEQYMTIAENYKTGPITDEALIKAYIVASSYSRDKEHRNAIRRAVKQKLLPRFDKLKNKNKNKNKYYQLLVETDALIAWYDEEYNLAFRYIDHLFEIDPQTMIVPRLLQLPHRQLPLETAEKLLDYIAKSKNIFQLDLSNYGIRSLRKLSNMNLRHLNCSGNQLVSLEGLEKMPLEVLNCSDNRLTSLKPLNMAHLTTLDISKNDLQSLDSISGSKLKTLLIRNNKISSLSPLRDLKLRTLDAGKTLINDLEPLKNMPLKILLLDHTVVSDLSPIRDLKLTSLSLYKCSQLKDLSPLEGIKTLQSLSIPSDLDVPDFLRTLPELRFITNQTIYPKSEDSSAEEFWEQNQK